MYLTRPATPALAPFVDAVWYVNEPSLSGLERAVPSGAMQIVVNLAEDVVHWYDDAAVAPSTTHGGGLCGILAGPVRIDAADQRHCVGASFRPGGAVPFFQPPAHVLAEPVIGLDSLWGRDGATLRERLLEQPSPEAMLRTLEQVLLSRVVRPGLMRPAGGSVADPSVAFGVEALARGATVGEVSDRLGVVPSTFSRRFRAAVGLNPKPFARVKRLQRVLGEVSVVADDHPFGRADSGCTASGAAGTPSIGWADVAARHGYFDQAHLINEFRALTGVTPSAYRPRSSSEHNHLPVTQ